MLINSFTGSVSKSLKKSAIKSPILSSWRRRITPFNNYSSWRGRFARLSSQINFFLPTINYSTTLFFNGTKKKHFTLFLDMWRLYYIYLPVNYLLRHSSKYIQSRLAHIFRGVGGLCYVKIQYKGKSFKWTRKAQSLVLRFGHSHLVAEPFFPGIRMRRRGRMKLVIYGSSVFSLNLFASVVCKWRSMNVYHGRGLRISRQAVLRKSGKVSAYR